MFVRVDGARRVRNVKVGDEPIDPAKIYTVAGTDYFILNHGNGHTAFDGATIIASMIKRDDDTVIDYIKDTLGGTIGKEYADSYGQGRITIIE